MELKSVVDVRNPAASTREPFFDTDLHEVKTKVNLSGQTHVTLCTGASLCNLSTTII